MGTEAAAFRGSPGLTGLVSRGAGRAASSEFPLPENGAKARVDACWDGRSGKRSGCQLGPKTAKCQQRAFYGQVDMAGLIRLISQNAVDQHVELKLARKRQPYGRSLHGIVPSVCRIW
jgi:hypothetical protein